MRVLKALFTLVALAGTMFAVGYCSFSAGMYVGEIPGSALLYVLIYFAPAILVGIWFYRAGVSKGLAVTADLRADTTTILDEYNEVLDEWCDDLSALEDENDSLRQALADANEEMEFAYARLETNAKLPPPTPKGARK